MAVLKGLAGVAVGALIIIGFLGARTDSAGLVRIAADRIETAKRFGASDGVLKPLRQHAYLIARHTLGPDHRRTVEAQLALGFLYLRTGQDARALPLVKDAYPWVRGAFGPTDSYTRQVANVLLRLSPGFADPAERIGFLSTTLADCLALGPDGCDESETIRRSLIEAYLATRQDTRAIAALEQAIAHVRPGGDPAMVRQRRAWMEQRAVLLEEQGRYAEAQAANAGILAADPQALEAAIRQAGLLAKDGKADDAVRAYADLLPAVPAARAPAVITAMADLHRRAGRQDEAAALYETAIEDSRNPMRGGRLDSAAVDALIGLAAIHDARGEVEQAEALLTRTQEAVRLDSMGPEVGRAATARAFFLLRQDRAGEALGILDQASASLADDPRDGLRALAILATYRRGNGRTEEADDLYQRLNSTARQERPGAEAPLFGLSLAMLAHRAAGRRPGEARLSLATLADMAYPPMPRFVTLGNGAEDGGRLSPGTLPSDMVALSAALSLALAYPDQMEVQRDAATVVLRLKGRDTEEAAWRQRLAGLAPGAEVRAALSDIAQARQRIARAPQEPKTDTAGIRRTVLEPADALLGDFQPGYRHVVAGRRAALADLMAALAARKGVLVEVVRFHPLDFETLVFQVPHYAVVLTSGSRPPRVLDLGPEDTMKSLIWAQAIDPQAQRSLHNRIIAPIMAYASDGTEAVVLAMPEGPLASVALEALPGADGRPWAARVAVSRTRTGRDLLPGDPARPDTGRGGFVAIPRPAVAGLTDPPRMLHITGSRGGMLRESDVLTLPLDGTELVVLSSCETGWERVVDRCGVKGLTQAFRTAGAANVLLPLRPVTAETGEAFLKRLETHLTGDGAAVSIVEALHRTRLDHIEGRADGDWSAFVLIGSGP